MKPVLFWHRRDLRIEDNAGLYKALKSGHPVIPLFIFDKAILDLLSPTDQRVLFIHQTIVELQESYRKLGCSMQVYYGEVAEIFSQICENNPPEAIYINRDYEPKALERDQKMYSFLAEKKIPFIGSKDQVIFEKDEIVKDDGKPYTVFTPYWNKWIANCDAFMLKPYPSEKYVVNLVQSKEKFPIPSLEEMGFSTKQTVDFPEKIVSNSILKNYVEKRDIPSVRGTSRLSVHLRFGTISIRKLAKQAEENQLKFLQELAWRDFYQQILYHFPQTVDSSFKPIYDRILWDNNEGFFQAWCEGKTGYPLVDAGMRELNATGFMHNRVRMLVASFLCKHLGIDWRWGEAYFAEKLLDYDQASNVGGWQWAAGSGCDAAPYFRIFSPILQLKKFDPDFSYVRKWIPEFGTDAYPEPIVVHEEARKSCLERYKIGLGA